MIKVDVGNRFVRDICEDLVEAASQLGETVPLVEPSMSHVWTHNGRVVKVASDQIPNGTIVGNTVKETVAYYGAESLGNQIIALRKAWLTVETNEDYFFVDGPVLLELCPQCSVVDEILAAERELFTRHSAHAVKCALNAKVMASIINTWIELTMIHGYGIVAAVAIDDHIFINRLTKD